MLIALAFFLTFSVGTLLGMILNSPMGFEDEAGFHFGEPRE